MVILEFAKSILMHYGHPGKNSEVQKSNSFGFQLTLLFCCISLIVKTHMFNMLTALRSGCVS